MRNAAVWAWKWRCVLLTNAFLVSPVLLYELRPFEGGPDKTILFTLSASVLWLVVVQLMDQAERNQAGRARPRGSGAKLRGTARNAR